MKKFLYVILALVLIYLILGLIGKPEVKVERSISINQSADLIKEKLQDLTFYHQWDPWSKIDPDMEHSFTGTPGQPGHSMMWKSENKELGTGTLTLRGVSGDSVNQALDFGDHGDHHAYYIVKGDENQSEVTWGLHMKVGFLMRPMMLFFNMEKMIGDMYEKGLPDLKKEIEKVQTTKTPSFDVKELEWPETKYAGSKKETLKVAELEAFFGKELQAAMLALQKQKIEPQSYPTAVYWKWDMQEMQGEVVAGFKVAAGTKVSGLKEYKFPAGKVLHVAYYGSYEKIGDAHVAIEAYMQSKGYTDQHAVFEEYVTDPGVEKDTAKWLTNVYYLLK